MAKPIKYPAKLRKTLAGMAAKREAREEQDRMLARRQAEPRQSRPAGSASPYAVAMALALAGRIVR